MFELTIINLATNSKIVSENPSAIPRKGDLIDMGYTPPPKVKHIIWKYTKDNGLFITAVVE